MALPVDRFEGDLVPVSRGVTPEFQGNSTFVGVVEAESNRLGPTIALELFCNRMPAAFARLESLNTSR
jgi:hypothetical protein